MIEAKMHDDVTIAQITDLHLFSDSKGQLIGYCTHAMLTHTIDAIRRFEVRPDACFLTGDISQDESVESYEMACSELERLDMPIFWIPGNHDDFDKADAVFGKSKSIHRLTKLSMASWDFIYLNTCRRGADEGYLNDKDFDQFAREIQASSIAGKNIAVVMHHHPIPVETPLIDNYILQSNKPLLRVFDANPQIKLVICGHVHGDYRILYGNQMIETCPATCFQWTKGTSTMQTENSRGFKVFQFSATGYESTLISV